MNKQRISLSDHFTYKRLFIFTLPPILMMIFTSVYGVVDGLFVSNCVGKTAFAAINLIMPFIMILGGIGFMIGTGGTALVAKVLGIGDSEKANRYFSMMIIFTIILGVILTAVGVAFTEKAARILGAKDEMIKDCVLYGRISILFTVAFMLQNVFQSFFVAAEKPKLGLFAILAAGFTNIGLDALFVAVFGWGVAGAALATGLSQCIGGVLPVIYFAGKNSSRLRLVKTGLSLKPLVDACINGSSELMSNISASVISMIYNMQLLLYIGNDGVSAYGVLMYVQFVFIAIFIGYAIGSAPVVSFHYGAQNHGELKNMLRKSTMLMLSLGAVLSAAAFFLAPAFSKMFVGYDYELYTLTNHAFKFFAISFLLSGFNIYVSSFFTALNNGAVSAAVSFLRTLVFQTSAVIILPLILGVDGIWWAITVAEICAFIISVIFLFAKKNEYKYM